MADSRTKTNAWIKQIMSSNIVYPSLVAIGSSMVTNDDSRVKAPADVIMPRMTCPALMFAASRNERVTGRM